MKLPSDEILLPFPGLIYCKFSILYVYQVVTLLEELHPIARRKYGASHPLTGLFQRTLDRAKVKLAQVDAGA